MEMIIILEVFPPPGNRFCMPGIIQHVVIQFLLGLASIQMVKHGYRGKIMGISRTRASEYLNKLEKESVVISTKSGRKKYYSLKGDA